MVQDELKLLQNAFSAERLTPYQDACAGDLAAALRLYAWNIEISAGLYGPLCCLEIALRNAMHGQLVILFGRSDWWEAPTTRLHKVAVRKVADAQEELTRRRKALTPGRMVAELPFGFWVSLLGYGNDYETRLWRPALSRAFPNYQGLRKRLHRDLDYVRMLRNRIAHHEAIYERHLAADYETIMRLIGYICPETAAWVARHDRVRAVLARRADVCANARPAGF